MREQFAKKDDFPKRKRIRIINYDYSRNGCYFITICTKNRECLFGDVVDGEMRLNEWGEIVKREIIQTIQKRDYIHIDQYVVMPNHVHLLISLYNADTARRVPTREQFSKPTQGSIPTIIRSFKSAVTNAIRPVGTRRAVSGDGFIIWQTRYHDHIVRNRQAYQKISEYIINNPILWETDCHNPKNPKYIDWNDKNV